MEALLITGPTPPSFILISILQVSLHPPEIFKTAGRRSSVTGESLVRSLSKVIAVNARGQEGSISETLLEIFKTSGRRRSLLAVEFLVWSSMCKDRILEG